MPMSRFFHSIRHALLAGVVSAGVAAVASVPVLAQATPSKQKVTPANAKNSQAQPQRAQRAAPQAKRRAEAARASARPKAAVRSAARSSTRPNVRAQQRGATRVAATAAVGAAAAAPVVVQSVAEQLGLRRLDDPLNLDSSAVLVIDQHTHEILLGKNDTVVLPIASLTKLMASLVIVEARLPMDEIITIESADVDRLRNSGSRLAVGSQLTRGQAMHLSLMSSENRAAHALGRTYPGGVDAFVRRMNERARELGMTHTRFADPTGLSGDNRSNARDMAALAAVTYQVPMLREWSTSPSYEFAGSRGVLQYRNSNRLVHKDDWDIGLQKTGFIREAGRCLVMQVSVAGRQVIMVLLDATGSAARVNDAQRLRRWVEATLLMSEATPTTTQAARAS